MQTVQPVCCKKRQKSPNQETGLGIGDLQDQFSIIQNLQIFPISQTSFLVGTYFVVFTANRLQLLRALHNQVWQVLQIRGPNFALVLCEDHVRFEALKLASNSEFLFLFNFQLKKIRSKRITNHSLIELCSFISVELKLRHATKFEKNLTLVLTFIQ